MDLFWDILPLTIHIGGINSPIGISTPGVFIIYTLPHGIFEISGIIVAGAAGFRLTSTIINIIRRNTSISEHYWELKDSLILVAIAIILIFIAAVIEANISLPFGNYITHLSLPN